MTLVIFEMKKTSLWANFPSTFPPGSQHEIRWVRGGKAIGCTQATEGDLQGDWSRKNPDLKNPLEHVSIPFGFCFNPFSMNLTGNHRVGYVLADVTGRWPDSCALLLKEKPAEQISKTFFVQLLAADGFNRTKQHLRSR